MSWINEEYKYSCFQNLALNILKQGVIPSHVAFIMDGNRRYAASRGLQKTEGHKHGFSKLGEVVKWCCDLGIKEVSAWAFSIENFKRTQNEVSFLMHLLLEKLTELAQHREELDKQGIRVRFLGNERMLPKKIQRAVAQIMLMTRENTRIVVNIMMPYTSRDELTSALDNIRRGVQSGLLREDDISPDVIERSSILRCCRPLDLLVRTSGEVRLSDFMLWQASRAASAFSFVTAPWPDLSFWHLVVALLQFQLAKAALIPLPKCMPYHLNRWAPESTANEHNGTHQPSTTDVIEEEERRRRLEAFFEMLEQEYLEELEEMSKLPDGVLDD